MGCERHSPSGGPTVQWKLQLCLLLQSPLHHLLLQLLHIDALLPRRYAVAGAEAGLAASGAESSKCMKQERK